MECAFCFMAFFKKMVIADNIGLRVDTIYAAPNDESGLTLFLASSLFFVQLYADFSAYTDIARGIAKLLGFELMKNFKTPLFSKSIPEFWARWHISLTTWFRDYFFIWLAGLNRTSTLWRITATIILFLVIGFWHGANYTFIIFGLAHGIFFIPRILARKNKRLRDGLHFLNNHKFASKLSFVFTFCLLTLTTILFRSENIEKAGEYYASMLGNSFFKLDHYLMEVLPLTLAFLVFEWINQHKTHPFDVSTYAPWLRRSLYVTLILSTLLFGYLGKEPFYYFQF